MEGGSYGGPTGALTSDERTWGMLAHALAVAGHVFSASVLCWLVSVWVGHMMASRYNRLKRS